MTTPICEPARRSNRSSISSVRSRSRTSPGRWLSWTQTTDERWSALLAKRDLWDRHVFTLALALGAFGLSAAAAASATAIASLPHSHSGVHQLLLGGVHFTYPTLNGSGALLMAVGALGAAAIAVAVRAGWRQARRYRTFLVENGPAEAV